MAIVAALGKPNSRRNWPIRWVLGLEIAGMWNNTTVDLHGSFSEMKGKMNFYLSAVDDLVRHKEDQTSIGIILCKDRNEIVVEYVFAGHQQAYGSCEVSFDLCASRPAERGASDCS